MKKSVKGLIAAIGTIAVIAVLLILRYNEVFPMGYQSIGLDGEYVKIQCVRYGKEVVNEITDTAKIEECVSKINEFEVREPDWFDALVGKDGTPKKGYLGGEQKVLLVFIESKGRETTLEFPYYMSKNMDMNYIRSLFDK